MRLVKSAAMVLVSTSLLATTSAAVAASASKATRSAASVPSARFATASQGLSVAPAARKAARVLQVEEANERGSQLVGLPLGLIIALGVAGAVGLAVAVDAITNNGNSPG